MVNRISDFCWGAEIHSDDEFLNLLFTLIKGGNMEQPSPVTRQSFDEWIVPTYAPADFIVVRGKGRHCGINKVNRISILRVVLR